VFPGGELKSNLPCSTSPASPSSPSKIATNIPPSLRDVA
jgi:hypothetical protein